MTTAKRVRNSKRVQGRRLGTLVGVLVALVFGGWLGALAFLALVMLGGAIADLVLHMTRA